MKYNNITPNEVLSTTMYLKVLSRSTDSIQVEDTQGQKFTVKGKKLIEDTMTSASQFDKQETVNRTRLAEILTMAGDKAFTAVFDRQDGTERTLVGRLTDTENYMGRSNAIDLLHTGAGSPVRQIDHRTIKSLILNNVKYVVK